MRPTGRRGELVDRGVHLGFRLSIASTRYFPVTLFVIVMEDTGQSGSGVRLSICWGRPYMISVCHPEPVSIRLSFATGWLL